MRKLIDDLLEVNGESAEERGYMREAELRCVKWEVRG